MIIAELIEKLIELPQDYKVYVLDEGIESDPEIRIDVNQGHVVIHEKGTLLSGWDFLRHATSTK